MHPEQSRFTNWSVSNAVRRVALHDRVLMASRHIADVKLFLPYGSNPIWQLILERSEIRNHCLQQGSLPKHNLWRRRPPKVSAGLDVMALASLAGSARMRPVILTVIGLVKFPVFIFSFCNHLSQLWLQSSYDPVLISYKSHWTENHQNSKPIFAADRLWLVSPNITLIPHI